MIHFDLPKEKSSIIKVIGVGGGGSNAVNHMFSQNIEGVNFIICNTDAQAIAQSKVPNKIQLGPNLTQGLGAGANPDIGRQATEESLEEIKRILEVNTKMAFITAGMGGGTGTGGTPIISKIARDLGILTVGIVTTPFSYEGKKRIQQAEEGIEKLKEYVDTLLVISNDKLRHQFGNLTMRAAFAKADNILATAAKCITDVITTTGQINVDFADVCTVMRNGGVAILGSAAVEGENRAQLAIEQALNSPLLNDNDISGAQWILININSAEGENEFTMDEVEIIQNYLHSRAGEDTDVILGMGYDSSLGNKIGITLIATGFEYKNPFDRPQKPVVEKNPGDEKIIMELSPIDEDGKPKPLKVEIPAVEMPDPMAPTLMEHAENKRVTDVIRSAAQTPENEAKEVMTLAGFSVPSSTLPSLESPHESNPSNTIPNKEVTPEIQFIIREEEASTTVTSSGNLAKPSNIYAEEPKHLTSKTEDPVEEPFRLPVAQKVDEPISDLQLVEKNKKAADEPGARTTHIQLPSVEDPALQDEADEQKRRAAERLHKLRNLSFNVNNADPNNEFETVPAYVRRNFQLPNALASVEKFYSNYTVKKDDNNQTQISTLNTFLDGKKPD